MSTRDRVRENDSTRYSAQVYQPDYVEPCTSNVPNGYKRTDVGIIPDGWQCVEISSLISDISMGPFGSDIKVSNFVSQGVPVLDGFNVRKERLLDTFSKFVTDSKANSLKVAVARRGDIVVTHRGTIGQISYIPEDSAYEKYVISQSQFRVSLKSGVTPNWVTLYFLSEQGSADLLEGKGHTGVPAIAQPTTTFRKLKIPLPPLTEQRAITAALSDTDALAESLDRLIAKKRAIKQAAMQQLLGGDSRLPGFDEEWKVSTLGEIAEIKSGATPSTQMPSYWGGTIPWCTPTDITGNDGKYLGATERNITEEGLRRCAAELLPKGALLLCTRATIGEVKIATAAMCTNQGFKSLVCSEQVSYEFIYYLLLTLKPKMLERAIGSTFLEIGRRDVAAIGVKLPSKQEQEAISRVLSDMDDEIGALLRRRDKARQIKQGMMQELLTGRTRLVEPNPEVAEEEVTA